MDPLQIATQGGGGIGSSLWEVFQNFSGWGETAALTAAFLWTLSSLFWLRIHMSALAINFAKNWLGTACFGFQLLLAAWLFGQPLFQATHATWLLLATSGFIGIVIGDTCYFRSLQILGPRKALMLTTTSPIFSAVLEFACGGGWLSAGAYLGIVATVGGIMIVVADKQNPNLAEPIRPGRFGWGVALACVAALCQSLGGLLSQYGLRQDPNCSALEASFIRLLTSALCTGVWVGYRRQITATYRESLRPRHWQAMVAGTIIGTWMGIWLSQVAFRLSSLPIASTLQTTSPLFAIPVLWVVFGERTSWRGLLGACLGVAGVYWLLSSS